MAIKIAATVAVYVLACLFFWSLVKVGDLDDER